MLALAVLPERMGVLALVENRDADRTREGPRGGQKLGAGSGRARGRAGREAVMARDVDGLEDAASAWPMVAEPLRAPHTASL